MRDIETVAVVGAGTMGHGIAQVCAAAGCDVRLYDVDEAAVQAGLDRIRGNLEKGIARGKVTEPERDGSLARLSGSTDLTAASTGADLVVEAAPESMALKEKIFTEVAAAAPSDALLATNTSSLSIARIAEAVTQPQRFLGMHFFNPVHIMALVEVVWGPDTSDEARDAAVAFARRLGKEPIVVKDAPGFASSRLGVVLGMEAIRMVEQEVASPEDIDKAMELGYRHPMGPLKLTDLVGLDVRLGIAEYLHETLGSDDPGDDMTDAPVLLEKRADHIALITLNRPEKLNALNADVRTRLKDLFAELATDEDVRAVVIHGAGEKAFVAGADITEFAARTAEEQREVYRQPRIYEAVADFPKPVIAALHGFCIGGGSELALACDVRVADRTTRISQAEIRIGLIPGGGGTQRLARLVGETSWKPKKHTVSGWWTYSPTKVAAWSVRSTSHDG
jgi:3-hydroxybutyryl-CoA dehydrogenase